MKTILVPTEANDVMDATLATALRVATGFGSHLEGFAVRVSVPTVVAMDVAPSASLAFFEEENAEAARLARAAFERFMQANGVPAKPLHVPAGVAPTGPSWSWLDDAPEGDNFVGHHGRVFDVLVIGRPSNEPHGPHMSTFEAGLFESGRPILLAPPKAPATVGEHVLIAWNCSTEQARAVGFAMPFLAKAKQVTILTVEGATVPGPSAEQLAASLSRHGITAALVATTGGDNRTAGPTILEHASRLGCDLIVKGAYTQSRLRQMIFGGTTRHILTHAEVPVLTAH
ncbi:putative stress protein UspA [Rhodovulum sp. PH10]|uniref:universal stress protein n=1 Tax=Rhodovulum sp. PH10 TaxID=1187851 RepID=UPI00027C1E2D|nr:universal stress protein [Rhodovulum sp. PH10]EJW12023.1 putative stress protein UspA [Rhodovulum sp. PH10]